MTFLSGEPETMTSPLQIACPTCTTANRVPGNRLKDNPVCGKCRKPLFSGHPAILNAGNFIRFLSQTDIPVVVDFWAPWCGPCKAMAPAFNKVAAELEPLIRLAKLDTQAHQQVAGQFNIRSIPTLIAFRNGKEIERMSGALPEVQLRKWIKRFL